MGDEGHGIGRGFEVQLRGCTLTAPLKGFLNTKERERGMNLEWETNKGQMLEKGL